MDARHIRDYQARNSLQIVAEWRRFNILTRSVVDCGFCSDIFRPALRCEERLSSTKSQHP
jgi:hypothetical protein